jgi:hypothetical protein
MKEKDLIISSFGKHPFELKRPSQTETKLQVQKRVMESVAKFDDDPETEAPAARASVNESEAQTEEAPKQDAAYRKWI